MHVNSELGTARPYVAYIYAVWPAYPWARGHGTCAIESF